MERAPALSWTRALSSARVLSWAVPIAVVLLTVLVRLPLLDRPAHVDEFFHVLAAQSLLDDGDLATMDGQPYARGWMFTYMVAGSFAIFGESFVVSRLVPLACGVLLVLALYLVVRRHAGILAGVAAAVPLALDPVSVQLGQFTRFYTLHALLFWIGAWSAYRLVDADRTLRRRVLDGVLVVVTLLIARHLQSTTIIGSLGIFAWVAAILVHRGLTTLPRVPAPLRRSPVLATAVLLLLGATAGIAVSFMLPELRALWGGLTYVPRWAMSLADDERFYLRLIAEDWPLLWLAFPVLAIGALRRAPRPASFALTVFAAVLIMHSVAAWKADRYIYYGMPFFYAACGIGIAWLVAPVMDATTRLAASVLGQRRVRWAPALSSLALIAAAGFALVQMPGVRRTQRYLNERQPSNADGSPGLGRPDWAAARDSLAPYVSRNAEVLTSSDVKAAFFLDRVDGFLHRPEPLNPSPGDTISPYTGQPRIFTPERFRTELESSDLALIVVEAGHWRSNYAVTDELADEIERRVRPIELPAEWRLRAFVWEGGEGASNGPDAGGNRQQ